MKLIADPFRDTVTCTVCGYARGVRVQLPCCCRGWVAFWRDFLAERQKDLTARRMHEAASGEMPHHCEECLP